MSTRVQSIISAGNHGTLVDIECHLSNNLPNIVIVGFANKAVDEARERIRGAFATSRIMLPRKRITINLAPADVPKADSGFDLAIAVAIWLASDQLAVPLTTKQAFIGELGLDGQTRAVRGIIGKILLGRAKGIRTFYIPAANLPQAQLIPKVKLVPIHSLGQLFGHLNLGLALTTINTSENVPLNLPDNSLNSTIALSEVAGQQQAKRALEIAAAGGHNVFFSGPPGTGKSMLAKALASILPPLSPEETLEVTHLHSLASYDYEQIITARPFRTPHHSASHVAIVGGGTKLRPGEISLAHRGVLFLDELPEFSRPTLEALRQPLEDRIINVARAKDVVQYPASFILVATANPCPCGYSGYNNKCHCLPGQIRMYANRLSGPILDRIDLYTNVDSVRHDKLLSQSADAKIDSDTRQRIIQARAIQAKRFASTSKLNADMTNTDLRQIVKLKPAALKTLNDAAAKANLSARAYMRTIKVARTIADLADSSTVELVHVIEALAYKSNNVREAL